MMDSTRPFRARETMIQRPACEPLASEKCNRWWDMDLDYGYMYTYIEMVGCLV